MDEAKHGVDYHQDGEIVGAGLLLLLLGTFFAAPVGLLVYLLLVVLPG